jgi:hypothetical protein
VLAEVVDRAGHGYERWAELVAQAGSCHQRICLAGRVEHADRQTGDVPAGLRLRLGAGAGPGAAQGVRNRRESRCPSCAATYRADAYQLLAAGLKVARASPTRWPPIPGCS